MVKVRASSAATKPKVLAGVFLLQAKLPSVFLDCGLGDALMEYEAPPRVWRFVLEHYPGAPKMLAFMEGEETARARSPESSIVVETVDEESSSAPRSVLAPDAVPSQVSVAEPFISSAQGGGSVYSNDRSFALDPNPFTNRHREPGTQDSWGAAFPSAHVPSWRDRGEVNSFPGATAGQLQDWGAAIRRSEVSMRTEVNARFMALDWTSRWMYPLQLVISRAI